MTVADVWQDFRLGEVTAEVVERIGKSDRSPTLYGVDRVVGLTATPKYASANVARYKLLPTGGFAYNPMRLNIGSIGFNRLDSVPGGVSPDYVVFRCLEDRLDPRFMRWFVQGPSWQAWTRSAGVGSVRVRIYFKELARMPVSLPPLHEQRWIADVLDALDDKIELNRRMSETLEETARALYKAWFVDFTAGPVADAAAPTLSDLPAASADGSTVGAEFDVTMGQSPPGSTYNTVGDGMPFYQGRADFGALIPTRRVYCTAPTRLARSGDTLLSVRAPVGDVNVAAEDCAIGRGVAALRHKSGSSVYTYFFARSLRDVLDTFNGEGTVFGSISKKSLLGLACSAPSSAAVTEFDRFGGPVLDRIRLLVDESSTLAATRDALLPKLISGELRVPDAERLVSEVA